MDGVMRVGHDEGAERGGEEGTRKEDEKKKGCISEPAQLFLKKLDLSGKGYGTPVAFFPLFAF